VGEHVWGRVDEAAVRMSSALAGGLGKTKEEMCGALSGGAMVIGGLYGREHVSESDERALSLAAAYRRAFLQHFGETQCAALRVLVEAPGDPQSCADIVDQAATILIRLLDS